MDQIITAGDKEVLVDDDTYKRIQAAGINWYLRNKNPRPYAQIRIGYELVQIPLDRFVYKLTKHPPMRIEHFNGNLDCRKAEMQLVPKKDCGYVGVKTNYGSWFAFAYDSAGQEYTDGPHSTPAFAARAYDKLTISINGQFVRTNFYQDLP